MVEKSSGLVRITVDSFKKFGSLFINQPLHEELWTITLLPCLRNMLTSHEFRGFLFFFIYYIIKKNI